MDDKQLPPALVELLKSRSTGGLATGASLLPEEMLQRRREWLERKNDFFSESETLELVAAETKARSARRFKKRRLQILRGLSIGVAASLLIGFVGWQQAVIHELRTKYASLRPNSQNSEPVHFPTDRELPNSRVPDPPPRKLPEMTTVPLPTISPRRKDDDPSRVGVMTPHIFEPVPDARVPYDEPRQAQPDPSHRPPVREDKPEAAKPPATLEQSARVSRPAFLLTGHDPSTNPGKETEGPYFFAWFQRSDDGQYRGFYCGRSQRSETFDLQVAEATVEDGIMILTIHDIPLSWPDLEKRKTDDQKSPTSYRLTVLPDKASFKGDIKGIPFVGHITY